ncbi:hypothetical protein Tco_1218830 [Tanacetum coccineum]
MHATPSPRSVNKLLHGFGVDSIDLNDAIRNTTCLRLFRFSICDQAINWLDRLPAGSISTWDDLITLNLSIKRGFVSRAYFKKCLTMALIFGSKSKFSMIISIKAQSASSIIRPVNDPRDLAKPVKAITLPFDVPSVSDQCLIELVNQVQRLMEAQIAPKQFVQVNKITYSCEICSGPHDTQYCMENLQQDFVDYASSRTNKTGAHAPMYNAILDKYVESLELGLADESRAYLIGIVRKMIDFLGAIPINLKGNKWESENMFLDGWNWNKPPRERDGFSTWMTFEGNTHDLGSFGEETDKTTDLHQDLGRFVLTECGDGVAIIGVTR